MLNKKNDSELKLRFKFEKQIDIEEAKRTGDPQLISETEDAYNWLESRLFIFNEDNEENFL